MRILNFLFFRIFFFLPPLGRRFLARSSRNWCASAFTKCTDLWCSSTGESVQKATACTEGGQGPSYRRFYILLLSCPTQIYDIPLKKTLFKNVHICWGVDFMLLRKSHCTLTVHCTKKDGGGGENTYKLVCFDDVTRLRYSQLNC